VEWALPVVLSLALLAGAILQKLATGIQVELITLGLLAAPLLLSGWSLREGLTASIRWTAAPALAALAAVRPAGVEPWGHVLLALALLFWFRPRRPQGQPAPESPGARSVSLALLALGAVAVVAGLALKIEGALVTTLLLIPLGWEALADWREQARNAALRRGATGWILLALSLTTLVREEFHFALPVACGLASLQALRQAMDRALTPEKRKRLRRPLLRLTAPLFLLLCLYACGEVAFQVVPNRYSRLIVPSKTSYFHTPNTKTTFRGGYYCEPDHLEPVEVSWNAHGWFDHDHELTKPAGTRRVLVVGDSYVEGMQVALEEHFHRILERELAKQTSHEVEAISYGWAGWGQRDERIAITEGMRNHAIEFPPGLDYQPDLVVLELLPANDIRNNHPKLEKISYQQVATPFRSKFVGALDRRLYFSAFLLEKLDHLRLKFDAKQEPIDGEIFRVPSPRLPELWEEAWQFTEAELIKIRDAVRARGARLVVVLFTSQMELNQLAGLEIKGFDFRRPSLQAVDLCAKLEIPCLDLAPLLVKKGEGRPLHYEYDGHWNAEAHRLAAIETARFLAETNVWPPEVE